MNHSFLSQFASSNGESSKLKDKVLRFKSKFLSRTKSVDLSKSDDKNFSHQSPMPIYKEHGHLHFQPLIFQTSALLLMMKMMMMTIARTFIL